MSGEWLRFLRDVFSIKLPTDVETAIKMGRELPAGSVTVKDAKGDKVTVVIKTPRGKTEFEATSDQAAGLVGGSEQPKKP